jgi:outer membrane biosynthesis protein TonB
MIVYVPAQAPSAAPATTEKSSVLVIEEPPPPPEPVETPTPPVVQPTTQRRQQTHTKAPTEHEESATPENPATPPAEVPLLEPRESSAQETELRRQYLNLEQNIRQRIARLNGSRLSGNDRKTLDDAQTFFAQSTRAMANGDLLRALNLARKASLLLAALE